MRISDLASGNVIYVRALTTETMKWLLCIQPPTPPRAGRFLYLNSKKPVFRRGDYEIRNSLLAIEDRGPTSILSFSMLILLKASWLEDPYNKARIVTKIDPPLAVELARAFSNWREDHSEVDAALISDALVQIAASAFPSAAE